MSMIKKQDININCDIMNIILKIINENEKKLIEKLKDESNWVSTNTLIN